MSSNIGSSILAYCNSWGYLFQLALLQACNYGGIDNGAGDATFKNVAGKRPFSLIESDLDSDPYSYASLSLVDFNRTALLDANILTNTTQRVFSSFFQWFASSQSGYKDNYWAYQPIGSKIQSGLDFGPVEKTVTTTSTGSVASNVCDETSLSTYQYEDQTQIHTRTACVKTGSTSYSYYTVVETHRTIEITKSSTSSRSSSSSSTLSSSTQSTSTPSTPSRRTSTLFVKSTGKYKPPRLKNV